MNFEVSFEDKGYFVIRTDGATTPEDVESSLMETFRHEKWEDGSHLLYDNRLEKLSGLSSHDVEAIAGVFTGFNNRLKGSRIALVMPGDVAFGLARMWEAFSSDKASFTTQVHRSLDEAIQWIES